MGLFSRTKKSTESETPNTSATAKRGIGAVTQRGFAAAEVSRILAPFTFDGGFSNREVQSALVTSRSRSRDMYKNSAHYRRFVSLFCSNVAGQGFNFKSLPHDGVPGYPNYRLDKTAAKFIYWHFWKWASNKEFCDSTGRKDLAEIDRLCAKMWARDGEYFILVDNSAQNQYGISLRVIRPDAVDERYDTIRENGNTVRSGVELDVNTLKPVAYYLFTTKEFATDFGARGPLIRIPASVNGSYGIIHGYTQEDEDQTRGMTLGHAVLKKLKMLDEFDNAELVAARDEACSVRTYHAPVGKEQEILNLCDPENPDAQSAVNALTMPKEPGQSEVLPNGWEQSINTPQHPNREVTAFKNSMLRDVASGLNLEYASFANDWAGVSFSSVRVGTIAERDYWMIAQAMMIVQLKTPVFLAWLRSFLSLSISGGYPLEKFEKFSEHTFRGRRWLWVDPMKDIKAAEIAVAHGWKTDVQIAEDFDADFDDNVEELKRKEELVKGTSLEGKKNEQANTATA